MMKILKVVLPLLVLIGATLIAIWLFATRPSADQNPPGENVTLVEVLTLEPVTRKVVVSAKGTVIPAREIVVQPEVSGRVVAQNKRLSPGGRIKKNELLVRIDRRDYELALSREKAALAQAEFQLKVEQGRKEVADYEWTLMDKNNQPTGAAKELTLRNPHIENSEAAVEAAKSGLERARLNVRRTEIKAPFNGMVRSESVEIGQLVTPQSRLATFIGTDAFWVQISVPVEKLDWIDVPGMGDEKGSDVTVFYRAGSGTKIERSGRVIRLLGDLDSRGRMAQLIVSVEDPLGLKTDQDTPSSKPLFLGSYVTVHIPGREIEDAFEIPRNALRDGDKVWLMDGEGRLDIRQVQVIWRESQVVYVRDGLRNGDRMVISRIPMPVSGMGLRVEEAE
ncbi:MAG: efflux RND transporter periplasmic adaptor subunit [Proteobacteria bacterium]|nr:efflux RND transporter periplasmic adaptor subunit [Pseudomonadota bacterium]